MIAGCNYPSPFTGKGDRAKRGGWGQMRRLAMLAPHPPRLARSPLPVNGEGLATNSFSWEKSCQ